MSQTISKELRQVSNTFFCVFNDSGANVFKDCGHIYSKMMKNIPNIGFIALIQHENEWDNDEKRIKTNHYHVYFNLRYYQRCSLNSMLTMIVETFHCNRNQISIEKATDECMCVRYLCHFDNMDKQPYLPFDVITNNQSLVGDYFNRIPIINDLRDFVEICKTYHWNTETIMLKVGAKNWKHYRSEYFDLKRDMRL